MNDAIFIDQINKTQILGHVAMMEKHDPNYAAKALDWYAKVLPWLGLK